MARNCTHKGAAKVMKVGECTIIAGGAKDINMAMEHLKPTVLMSVGGESLYDTAIGRYKVNMNPKAQALFKKAHKAAGSQHTPQASIIVDWGDGEAPPMDRDWWEAFVTDIKRFKGSIAVFCMGGHGRTGTTLTILAALSGACGKEDPVTWVRSKWCNESVETKRQVDYLRSIGIATKEDPAHFNRAKPVTVVSSHPRSPFPVQVAPRAEIGNLWEQDYEVKRGGSKSGGTNLGPLTADERRFLATRDDRTGAEGECGVCCVKRGFWVARTSRYECTDCYKLNLPQATVHAPVKVVTTIQEEEDQWCQNCGKQYKNCKCDPEDKCSNGCGETLMYCRCDPDTIAPAGEPQLR